MQTLANGLQSLDSGLQAIEIRNQDGSVLASWVGQDDGGRTIHCSQSIDYVGQTFGSIDTSWRYRHFAGPLLQAKVRSTAITLVVLLLLIIGLAILLQYYLIRPLHYFEKRIRSVGDIGGEPVVPQRFVSRELRGISEAMDDASIVLAEKAQAEAEMLTERARAEDAEAAAQAKMDFLSLMSHEIRTPLGAMMGFGKLLESADLSKEERGFLNNLNSSGSLLLHVVNDILDLSKIEATGIEYELRAIDAAQLLKEVEGMVSSLAREKGVRLRCDTDGLTAQEVLGDEHRIKQVLVNLVGNAIKFTDEGEVVIKALEVEPRPSSDETEPDVAHLKFEVTDTGIGMTEEQCQQIFSPFSQADSTVTRRFGGTGLGLSVSSKMVKGMGGELSVESEPGRGSVFSFELPMPIAKAIEEPVVKKTSDPPCVNAQTHGGKLKILVAEDELMLRILLKKVFANFGYQIEMVEDGKACLERLQQGIDFDLLFVDLHMPMVGGWEIVRSLRGGEFGDEGKKLKLAVMSGDIFAEDDERALGVDAFISKPLDLQILQKFLSEVENEKTVVNGVVRTQSSPTPEDRPLHVLVVEDQPLNRFLMEELLSRQGVKISLAEDGIACLEFLATHPTVDGILMDWRMPRMDGVTAAREIRSGSIPGFTTFRLPSFLRKCSTDQIWRAWTLSISSPSLSTWTSSLTFLLNSAALRWHLGPLVS